LKNIRLSFLFLSLFFSHAALADKFDFMLGTYQISAKVDGNEVEFGNLGSYKVQYNKSTLNQFDLFVGYTVNMVDIIGGDMGFGPDLGFNYFPLSFNSANEFEKGAWSILSMELWRPYVGLSFNQRSFQSIKNSYAGFGFNLGTEYSLSKLYSAKAEFRYITMAGTSESLANETNFLIGISLSI
jgi:opacity protein-like surface antigen